jgi:hypothetical protein
MTPDPKLVQRFIANGFGIGVIRRMAPPGTLSRVIRFLENLDLTDTAKQSDYPAHLNDQTIRFMKALPATARHWGMARKCLNLFFRDSLYNFYLHKTYSLGRFESVMEIPLDSYVGRALRREDRSLPQWRSVISLTEAESAKFQAAASKIATREGTFRVHLDLKYFRAPES